MASAGKAVAVVLFLFMALLSFRGIGTPSLKAQGEQRRPSFFNIRRDIPKVERPGSLEVDNELELRGLLHRQIGRLGTFQYFVNITSRPIQSD
jgi:hypothetical protein